MTKALIAVFVLVFVLSAPNLVSAEADLAADLVGHMCLLVVSPSSPSLC